MPRETIHGSGMPINVSVAWGNNETVQVATINQDHDAVIRIVNEWLEAVGLDPVDADHLRARFKKKTGSELAFDGWHSTLDDWAGVNRLIKVLKRARDQAFGAPE